MTLSPEKVTTLYEIDYLLWIETTLQQLRDRDYNQVDWQNLLEAIEDMGKSERHSIKSNLTVVLMHLLKWEFQPQCRTGSWAGSITQHRTRILYALEDSPSLNNYLPEVLETAYSRARQEASDETQLPLSMFPLDCPYAIEQVLDDEFWPDGNDRLQSPTVD